MPYARRLRVHERQARGTEETGQGRQRTRAGLDAYVETKAITFGLQDARACVGIMTNDGNTNRHHGA